jgi:hypothetical protein
MPSAEACSARRMAVYYKQHDLLKEEADAEYVAHVAGCETCQAKKTCWDSVFLTGAQERRHGKIQRCRNFIASENADQKYADEARLHGVEPKHHKDGWCRYWQNLRARRFALNNWRCETSGCEANAQDCHHPHYDTLGFEELVDVRALCRKCHKDQHPWAR